MSDRFHQAKNLFAAALDLPPTERQAFLETAAAGQPSLQVEVEALLAADQDAAGFLENPALQAEATQRLQPGDRLGPYEVLRQAGVGGMGEVFLAVRADAEYRQQVAIKVTSHAQNPELRERFRIERQILADLEHAHIARLLDGGTTDSGLPYLVMEYIDGVEIDAYCRQNDLSVDQRIALFEKVCDAVGYAHGNLVVHRDLKPANILITREGEPKLLDFGIAKLLEPTRQGQELTGQATRLLTPHYASPEQLRGQAISVATDVYSLGVLLYSLLTGRLPRTFAELSPTEVERVLTAETVATTEIDRDLDRILLKSLEERPEHRYSSVEQFVDDLWRYREGLPIKARPNTLSYRTGKFLRRHRVAATAALVAVCLLLVFSFDKARQAKVLAAERDHAVRKETEAEALSDFLVDLLESSDPWSAAGEEVTVRQVLERGAAEIPDRFSDQPIVRAKLLDTMGTIFFALSQLDKSGEFFAQSLELRLAHLPPNHEDTAISLSHLGTLRAQQGNYPEAVELNQRAVDALRANPTAEPVQMAGRLYGLGIAHFLTGKLELAEQAQREALELHLEAGSGVESLAEVKTQLATVLTQKGSYDEAETLLRQALDDLLPVVGDSHSATFILRLHLSNLLLHREDLAGAEVQARKNLEISQQAFGPESRYRRNAAMSLSAILIRQNKLDEAEVLLLEALEGYRRAYGEEHRDVAALYRRLGRIAAARHDFGNAEGHFRSSLAIIRKVMPGNLSGTYTTHDLGRLLLTSRRLAEAEPLLQETLTLRLQHSLEDSPLVAESRSWLGAVRTAQGRFAEAEELLLAGHGSLVAAQDSRVAVAAQFLVELYEAWGKPENAAEYRNDEQVRSEG